MNNCMQVTEDRRALTNFDGSLKAQKRELMVKKNKGEYLGRSFLALLMQAAIGSRCRMEGGLERFIKTSLFLITTIEGYGLDRIIRLQ